MPILTVLTGMRQTLDCYSLLIGALSPSVSGLPAAAAVWADGPLNGKMFTGP